MLKSVVRVHVWILSWSFSHIHKLATRERVARKRYPTDSYGRWLRLLLQWNLNVSVRAKFGGVSRNESPRVRSLLVTVQRRMPRSISSSLHWSGTRVRASKVTMGVLLYSAVCFRGCFKCSFIYLYAVTWKVYSWNRKVIFAVFKF